MYITEVLIPNMKGHPLGLAARGRLTYLTDELLPTSIETCYFRVRRNNGAAGGIPGKIYQDCIKSYTFGITHTEAQQANRSTFAAGVSAWQGLSEEEKEIYRDRARKISTISGYHLYLSEYMCSH